MFLSMFPFGASVEPRCEKTGLRGFRPGPTQTGLYSHRRWLEAWKFGVRKSRKCTIRVAKTRALISFAVAAKLICVFVFAYAESRFSHDAAPFIIRFVRSIISMLQKLYFPRKAVYHLILLISVLRPVSGTQYRLILSHWVTNQTIWSLRGQACLVSLWCVA